jgi:hypothetical protein
VYIGRPCPVDLRKWSKNDQKTTISPSTVKTCLTRFLSSPSPSAFGSPALDLQKKTCKTCLLNLSRLTCSKFGVCGVEKFRFFVQF